MILRADAVDGTTGIQQHLAQMSTCVYMCFSKRATNFAISVESPCGASGSSSTAIHEVPGGTPG
jgi:hypothetical protein